MFRNFVAAAAALVVSTLPAAADKLDDVINNGVLRCGVVLDFPPIGFRNAQNEPDGFDVQYCKDLANALSVDVELLPATWSERLPMIVTNRADVVVGSTSDALDRATTVGFSIPYIVFLSQAVVSKDSDIETFEDLKGKRVAGAIGTVQEGWFLEYAKEWGTEDLYQGYQSENEVFLAVAQGKAEAGLTTNTTVGPITRQYDTIKAGPILPFTPDFASLIGPRKDVSWLNYLSLFVSQQIRTGRYAELWKKYVGSEAPDLTIPGSHY